MTNNQPHPNPKDVEAWMVSLGFVEDKGGWWWHPEQAIATSKTGAQFFYTIHHTALTSFRDEVLSAGPKYKQASKASPDDGRSNHSFRLGGNAINREWRKAIQTISERRGL